MWGETVAKAGVQVGTSFSFFYISFQISAKNHFHWNRYEKLGTIEYAKHREEIVRRVVDSDQMKNHDLKKFGCINRGK